jgi:2,3-dihydroxybenzoate---[aryl-carrier protein] ligase
MTQREKGHPNDGLLDGFTPWPAEVADYYRRKGYWTGQTLAELADELADRHGDRVAVADGKNRWTYRELGLRSRAVAAGLHRLGVRPHDRVVVQLPNIAEIFEVVFGLFRLGAIPVMVVPAYRRLELTSLCRNADASGYVAASGHCDFDFAAMADNLQSDVPTLRTIVMVGKSPNFTELATVRITSPSDDMPHIPAPDPNDVALLHLSGGTTATPKLIPRTHNDYLYGARASAELCGFTSETVYLCSLPAAHQFSLSAPGALGTFLCGGRVALAPNSAPEVVFPLIEQERVTVAATVPAVATVWLEAASSRRPDLSSLRLLQVGGARLRPAEAQRVRPTLGAQLQQVYGMTEGLLNFTRLDDAESIVCTTQGRPLSPDDEIRIVDDDHDVPDNQPGQLLIRGPNTIRGYYRAPEHDRIAFTPDGFYRTGDVVRRTSTGHLIVEGRVKDQINCGGQKVSADEIEQQLSTHAGVTEAAIVAMPDPYLGERICAYVVKCEPSIQPRELQAFLDELGLAKFKIPDRIEFVATLPRTPVGKIDKKKLREMAAVLVTTPGVR